MIKEIKLEETLEKDNIIRIIRGDIVREIEIEEESHDTEEEGVVDLVIPLKTGAPLDFEAGVIIYHTVIKFILEDLSSEDKIRIKFSEMKSTKIPVDFLNGLKQSMIRDGICEDRITINKTKR